MMMIGFKLDYAIGMRNVPLPALKTKRSVGSPGRCLDLSSRAQTLAKHVAKQSSDGEVGKLERQD